MLRSRIPPRWSADHKSLGTCTYTVRALSWRPPAHRPRRPASPLHPIRPDLADDAHTPSRAPQRPLAPNERAR
eukprot:1197488-Prymnesium_polylepis.1